MTVVRFRKPPARGAWRAGLLALLLLAPLGCSPAGPALHRVTLHGVRFDPDSVVIAVGDTVEWANRDLVPHTATADDGAWASPGIPPDSSWRAVIRSPGAHPYHCAYHPTMKARLVARGR